MSSFQIFFQFKMRSKLNWKKNRIKQTTDRGRTLYDMPAYYETQSRVVCPHGTDKRVLQEWQQQKHLLLFAFTALHSPLILSPWQACDLKTVGEKPVLFSFEGGDEYCSCAGVYDVNLGQKKMFFKSRFSIIPWGIARFKYMIQNMNKKKFIMSQHML